MAGRFSFLASLLATSAAAPAAGSGDGDPLEALELGADDKALLGREVQAFVATAETKGFQAGTTRAVEVMGSDKGKANPTAALQLLGNEKLSALTSAELIAAIPDAPAAAAPPPPAAEEPAGEGGEGGAGGQGGSAEHQKRLAASPKVALGRTDAKDPAVDGAGDDGSSRTDKAQVASLWGNVQGTDTKISKAA